MVKSLPANAGNTGSIPWSGRSPEKEMATHSSILAWRIPGTEEPSGQQSAVRKIVGYNLVTKQQQQNENKQVTPR